MKKAAIGIMPIAFGPALCELQDASGKPWTGVLSQVEQYVTAYRVEPEKLARLLPEGYQSLRPVLRLNVELLRNVAWLAGKPVNRIELNTPVEYRGRRGWLNLVTWEDHVDSVLAGRDIYGISKLYAEIPIEKKGPDLRIAAEHQGFRFLEMTFHRVGVEGGCPKEADNEGTFYPRYVPNIANRTQPDAAYTSFTAVEPIDGKKEYCDCDFQWHAPTFEEMPAGFRMLHAIRQVEKQEVLGAYAVEFARIKNYEDQVIL